MSIEDIADMAMRDQWIKKCHDAWGARIPTPIEIETAEVIDRARLAATDDAQWSSKELKQVIRDLLRVTGL